MGRVASYRKNRALGGKKLLKDGQGAAKRKVVHTRNSSRHKRSFRDLREGGR